MERIDLNDMRFFVATVQAGSLSRAAEQLNLPKSRLSRRLTELETALGSKLIDRSRNGVRLNELGEPFYRHAVMMLECADNAVGSVAQSLSTPQGLLRDFRLQRSAAIGDYTALEPIFASLSRGFIGNQYGKPPNQYDSGRNRYCSADRNAAARGFGRQAGRHNRPGYLCFQRLSEHSTARRKRQANWRDIRCCTKATGGNGGFIKTAKAKRSPPPNG
jgi:hypothetical protein